MIVLVLSFFFLQSPKELNSENRISEVELESITEENKLENKDIKENNKVFNEKKYYSKSFAVGDAKFYNDRYSIKKSGSVIDDDVDIPTDELYDRQSHISAINFPYYGSGINFIYN